MKAFVAFCAQIVLFGALVAALLSGVALAAAGDPRWFFLSLGAAVVVVLLALLSTVPRPARRVKPDDDECPCPLCRGYRYADPVDDRYYVNRQVLGDE